jgi:hypothetical protein
MAVSAQCFPTHKLASFTAVPTTSKQAGHYYIIMSSATGKDRQRKVYFSGASYAVLTFLTIVECRLTLPYHLQNAELH